MLYKSCPYCGRVHPVSYRCPKQGGTKYRGPISEGTQQIEKFRRSRAWQKKRIAVLQRDYYLCRVCNAGTHYVFADDGKPLQVHHIEPLTEAWDKRLDEDNLIALCWRHHEMAEANEIPKDELKQLAQSEPRWDE